MLVKLHDRVQVKNGPHRGKFGRVSSMLPKEDDKVVVYIYHEGKVLWPHIAKTDLTVLTEIHHSCR